MTVKLHSGPVITGTAAERAAYSTTTIKTGTLWIESDTDDIFLWDGSAWDTMATLPVSAADVEIEEIGTATYDDVQDWINSTQSAGYVSGGLITAHAPADGSVDISAVKGFLKTTDSEIGVTQSFDLAGTASFALTDGETNYIYVDFVSGPRFQVTTTRSNVEMNRQFTLGRVYRDGTVTHIIQSGVQLPNFLREEHERVFAVHGFQQASGGAISEVGLRFLLSTAGVFYLGRNKIETTGVDTSGAATFTRHYHNAAGWVSDAQSQICAAAWQYDTGVALANIAVSRYGVFWVFIHFDSDLHVVVGRGSYKLAEAQGAMVPALPDAVNDFSILAAKVIIEQGGANFYSVESAYPLRFGPSGAFDHNDLGNIQGGAADDYYHFTLAQHTVLVAYDHGGLAGLGDDDHTIYFLADGSRTLTGDLIQSTGHDVFPNTDGRGFAARLVNSPGLALWTAHFRPGETTGAGNGTLASYSWQGAPLGGAPASESYAYVNDYMRLVDANKCFLSKAITNAAASWQNKSLYARVAAGLDVEIGMRFDAGDDNNWVELYFTGVAADATQSMSFRYRDNGGGITTVASAIVVPAGVFYTIRLLCLWSGGHYYGVGYIVGEDASSINVTGFTHQIDGNWTAGPPTAGRSGIIVNNCGNAGIVDWFYDEFT